MPHSTGLWVINWIIFHDQPVWIFPQPWPVFLSSADKTQLDAASTLLPGDIWAGNTRCLVFLQNTMLRTNTKKKFNLEISNLANPQTLCKRAFLRFFFANFTRAVMSLLQARGSGCSKRLPFQIDGGHCAPGNFQSIAFFCVLPENCG